MEKILVTYWLSIVLAFLFVLVLAVLWKKGKREQVKFMIYWLVAEAERKLGSKSGKYKYGHVIERFYSRLPFIITLFFTRKEIDNLIELEVKKLKEYLNAGNNLRPDVNFYDKQYQGEEKTEILR